MEGCDNWTNRATEDLWRYLTQEGRAAETRRYLDEALDAALRGRVRLVARNDRDYEPGEVAISETAVSVTAARLAHRFGKESTLSSGLESWPEHAARCDGREVDYRQIADRLLRRFAREPVPGREAAMPVKAAGSSWGGA